MPGTQDPPCRLLLVLLFSVGLALAQQTSLSVPATFPCKSSTQFFDVSSLNCQDCDQVKCIPVACQLPHMAYLLAASVSHAAAGCNQSAGLCCLHTQAQGYYPAADQLSCVLCDSTAGNDTSFSNGFSMAASWTPAALTNTGRCTCVTLTASSVLSSMQDNGRTYGRCLDCPAGTTADKDSSSCVPAGGAVQTPGTDLAYVLSTLNAKGAGISASTATQVRWVAPAWCRL